MRRKGLLSVLMLFGAVLFSAAVASAQDTAKVVPELVIVPRMEKAYNCGDSFEIIVMNEPVLSNEITRKLTEGKTQYESVLKTTKGVLFNVRVRVRNLQHETVRLKPESFKLVGYMYNKGKVYTPAAIQETDFRFQNLNDYSKSIYLGKVQNRYKWALSLIKDRRADISDLYVNPEIKYFFFNEEMPSDIRPTRFMENDMLPLRVWDLNVIFDVSTALESWELVFEPLSGFDGAEEKTDAEQVMEAGPCKVTLKFALLWDSSQNSSVRIYPK